jgi:hypothetical protein
MAYLSTSGGKLKNKIITKSILLNPAKPYRSNPTFTAFVPDGFLSSHPNLQGATYVTFGSLSNVANMNI